MLSFHKDAKFVVCALNSSCNMSCKTYIALHSNTFKCIAIPFDIVSVSVCNSARKAVYEAFTSYDFKFPKWYHMTMYVSDIKRWGPVQAYDAGPKERYNKDIRYAYMSTSKRRKTQGAEVCLLTIVRLQCRLFPII